jgi:hypothetical protein
MTYHWQSLDIPGRIEAIKAVYIPGASMADLAKCLGVSRQAIAGMYNRYRDSLERQSLRKPYHPGSTKTRANRRVKVAVPKPAPKPAPEPVMRPAKPQMATVGRSLMMLQRGQCKWPVNDAAKGEEHLFCGMPAHGSYCKHHKAQSTTENPGWGYR